MAHMQQPHKAERHLRMALKDTITPEQYHAVLQRLIQTAISGAKDIDATNAAKIIIDRLEGKIPESIIHHIANSLTIDDILNSPGNTNGE